MTGTGGSPPIHDSEDAHRASQQIMDPGDRSRQFRVMFDSELRYVWNTLRYLGVRSEDLRDLAHEVFLTVHERFNDCDTTRSVRPWLFVIAYHAACNYRRLARHRREVLVTQDPDRRDETADTEKAVATREQWQMVHLALEEIDLSKRAVLLMHDMDGLAMPEIAEALSIPLNTAYSRLRLARKELQDAVANQRKERGGA